MEFLRLDKTFKITKSNHQPSTITLVTTNQCPQVLPPGT